MKKLFILLTAAAALLGQPGLADEEPAAPAVECVAAVEAPAAVSAAVAEEPAAAETTPAEGAATEKKSAFCGTFWALAPALFAIVLALMTKEVYSSLFAGVVLGACFVCDFSALDSMDFVVNQGLITALKDTSGVFIFLVVLGAFVCMINKTGAALAFGEWAQKNIKSRIGSQLATFVLGILIFIDDYFNCLAVGSVMRPVTDVKRVSRAKLAYIIDSTAAPVCMIAPISSWAAAVSQYSEGTGYNGLELFIQAIPYNFYSLLALCFVVMIILSRFDFGPMVRYERNAIKHGDLHTVCAEIESRESEDKAPRRAKLADLIVPVLLLIAIETFALVYVGGILEGKSFADAISATDATVALPWGALIAMAVVIVFYMLRRCISFRAAMRCIPEGFVAMVPAILILTLATSLKNVTSALEAREFIAMLVQNSASGLLNFLPAVIFVVAGVLAFSTGTSWATFGILIPIVVATFDPSSPLMYIGMSACLAGAVAGDHCSPISDTTIMSSAGAQCDHLSHVSTQLPYVITVSAVSFVAFLLAGFVQNWFIVFPLALVSLWVVLCVMKRRYAKLHPEED
ncbi:MAG: Na+/H+ antiporter NhaC family protein [Akkermansia sp.]|nr:Na+/H+ antiporter NhaC family protein [Akkermansia sp.]